MKKIFIIISVVLVVLAVAFGVYFGWKKSKEILGPPMTSDESGIGDQESGIAAESKLKIVSDQPAFYYWLKTAATSSEIFYANSSGQILKIKENGDDEIISERQIENLQLIEANKDGDKIIVKSDRFEIFDAKKMVWQAIPNVSAATFSPDGGKIAYLDDSAISNLTIKDLLSAKQSPIKILSLNQNDFGLKWLSSEKILLLPKPSASIMGEIWEIDIKKKSLKKFLEGFGLTVNWAKDNSLGLKFSVNQQKESQLVLIDNTGSAKANFSFSSLPDKCLITLTKLYCAISRSYNTIKEPILPDDYLKRAAYSNDAIYELKLEEGEDNPLTAVFNENQPVLDAINFNLSDNRLFFTNRYDNKIYSLEL